MAEMDAFDRSLTAAFLRLVDEVPGDVDGIAVAHRVALEHPRRRMRAASLGMGTVPRLAWIVLLAVLLATIAAAALLAGAQRNAFPMPALLASPRAVVTLAPATLEPAPTLAPGATPIPVPPGELSPSEAAGLGVPVVTPSALGRIAWTAWLPSPIDSGALPLNTPHGPVILQGQNLLWRSPSGAWTAAPILGTATWPGAALGDDLILSDSPRPSRFHWTESGWVRAGTVEGLEGFRMEGLVAGPGGLVAFGSGGLASSADGVRFVRATDGPSCVVSVVATGDRFVALSGSCADSRGSWFVTPIPWTSTDGLRWQPAATTSPFGSGATITGVASHDGRSIAIGVAWAAAEPHPSASPAPGGSYLEPAAWVTEDGLAWRRLPALPEPPCDPATCAAVIGFRTIVASDAGWLILSFGGEAWTSANGLTWEPLHGQPDPWFGYYPPQAAMSSDLIVIGSESYGQVGNDFRHPVAIGTILGP